MNFAATGILGDAAASVLDVNSRMPPRANFAAPFTAATLASTRQNNVPDTPAQHKLRKAAEQFESMLLSNLWKSMKSSFDDDDDTDPASGALQDWSMEAMSSAVGKAGGLGIAKLILQHLEPRIAGSTQTQGVQNVKLASQDPKVTPGIADMAY